MSKENTNLSEENIEPKIGIFRILDYDLDVNERRAKFMKYDYVLCEICKQGIDRCRYRCKGCYYEETDSNEQNRMNYGICTVCFKTNIAFNCCSSRKFFDTSDYDLNYDGRKAKYEDYDHVLCEKCNQEIDNQYYCTYCFNTENTNEQNRMQYGRCKVCFKANTDIGWCLSCKIEGPNVKVFKTSDYDLDYYERSAKYK